MTPNVIVYLIRAILCNEQLQKWLREEAKKTNTPIDDLALDALDALLCGDK